MTGRSYSTTSEPVSPCEKIAVLSVLFEEFRDIPTMGLAGPFTASYIVERTLHEHRSVAPVPHGWLDHRMGKHDPIPDHVVISEPDDLS